MQKKKLFLLTGMMRSMCNWQTSIDVLNNEFKKQDEHLEIIPLDVPGMGIHHSLKSPLSIEENVEFLKKRFDANKGDINLMLGFSLGGMITSKWTQLYPNDLDGVILVTTSFTHLQNPLLRLKPKVFIPMLRALMSKSIKREELLYDAICNNSDHKSNMVKEWFNDQQRFPVSSLNVFRQLIAGLTFKSKKIKLDLPTLVLAAPKDNLVNSACSMAISNNYKTKLSVHDWAGHDILNDDPKWVAKQITDFIESN